MPRPSDLPSRFPVRHPALRYKPPLWMRLTRWLMLAAAGVTALVAAYVGYWFYGAYAMRTAVENWAGGLRAIGHEATWERMGLVGFPLWVAVRLDNPRLAGPPNADAWSWQTERMTMRRRPWEFSRIEVDLTGEHWASFPLFGKPLTVNGRAGRLVADLAFDKGGWPWQGAIRATDLALGEGKSAGGFAAGAATVKLQRGEGRKNERPILFDLLVEGQQLRFPEAAGLALGPLVKGLAFEGSWVGDLPKLPLVEALAKWRDDGGTLEVLRLGIQYGALDLNAGGTLALDSALQPIGAFTAKASGFFEVIDALRAKGLIRGRDSSMAKVVLGMLSKKSDNGGNATISLPLSIQDRTLFAGPVELAKLQAIDWNAAAAPKPDADTQPPPPKAAPRTPVTPQPLPPPGKG